VHAAATLVRIAQLTLQADLALQEGRADVAVPWLQQAVAAEDALAHDEPHLWLAPTRHALGAGLLAAGRPDEAERVFMQDLQHYPDNGWSLAGLAQAQRASRREDAARASDQRQRLAWRDADVAITSARL
jgi:tetratricopeptide (TPR) repeat protein